MHKNYRSWLSARAEQAHVDYYGEHLSLNERQAICSMNQIPDSDNYFVTINDLLDMSTRYFVEFFTPESENEYPDITGESGGAYWIIEGLNNDGYTFIDGQLEGKTVQNNNGLIWVNNTWIISNESGASDVSYLLDGSLAITAPFAGGGQQIKNIADATDDTDALSFKQLKAIPAYEITTTEINNWNIAYLHSEIVTGNPHQIDFDDLITHPTTLDGYGIIDARPVPTDEVEATDTIVVNVDVGGYKAGDTLNENTTVKEFMEKILRLYSLPTIKEYESIHTVFSGITNINEVASTVNGSVVPTIKDGLIANADHSTDTALKGGHDTLTFSGTGIDTATGAINTSAILGNNTYTTSIHFLQGTAQYYDSNGVAVNNLDSERNEETKTYSISFKGIYPKMYGMSAADFSADTTDLYATLTHDLSYVSTTEYYDINGTDSYIYFVLPANHEITRVVDGNGFDVTGNFSSGIYSVVTPNYTTNFYILKSIALTSVSPTQTYKIITKTA